MAPEPSARDELVKQNCPAFTNASKNVHGWMKENMESTRRCPAFREGCPFREVQNINALQQAVHKALKPEGRLPQSVIPEAPVGEMGSPANDMLLEMLQLVHQASQATKDTIGNGGPVCPFKSLVSELELRSWSVMIPEETSPRNAEDTSPRNAEVAVESPAEDEVDIGLASKLKEGTKEAHSAAETVHFVREFIKGRVPREVYAQMVVNLYHVYKALEEGLDKCWEHALVEPLYFPEELRRAESLRADADFFCGQGWEERTQPSPVTMEYVARLREIAATSPELLVPHAYTRYLGDLSGGVVLRRAAIRGLKLPKDTGEGVNFYVFKRIPDAKAFKNMYRARLDALKPDNSIADGMVVEANYAFALNTRMFQELDKLSGFKGDAIAIAAAEAATSANATKESSIGKSQDAMGCPFAGLAAAGMAKPEDHPPVRSKKQSCVAKSEGAAQCPFAALAASGIAMPQDHPPVKQPQQAKADDVVTMTRQRGKSSKPASTEITQAASQRRIIKLNAMLAYVLAILCLVASAGALIIR